MSRVYVHKLQEERAVSIADRLASELESSSLVDLCFLKAGDLSLYNSGTNSLSSDVVRLLAERGYSSLRIRLGRQSVIYEKVNTTRIDGDEQLPIN